MKFEVGQKVLIPSDLADVGSIKEYTISKVGKDTIQCGSPENTFYKAFCWPIECRDELIAIVGRRQELKTVFEDSLKLIYELSNRVRN